MSVAKCFFVVVLLSAGQVLAEAPEPDAKQLLTKMNQAMATLNYQGTVAFLKNDKLEPMKYSHAAANGKQQERLLSLNSPLREIVRDADKVSCLFKETRQSIVDHRPFEHSFLVDVPGNLDDLDGIYQFEVIGSEDVALLPSYVVAIVPKDKARYSRKIWIEKQQFLPLKVVLYDNSGVPLEQLVFTEIAVKEALPIVDVSLSDTGLPVQHIHQSSPQSSAQATFKVTDLPKGFHEVFFIRKPMHNAEQPVDHLLLSDGFATVSIYMENQVAAVQSGLQSVGAVNSYSRTLNNYELTVMGEVPAETIKLIAEGVKLRD
ncbi:MAG: MucB/RseB C-terminal domain-containing protein [Methylococcales bacterium]|nr:MucB/RseB C-terminal domain-containing protein [Methylococcales bacterium]